MNLTWIAISAVAALLAYFIVGGIFFVIPALKEEFAKHSAVYRGEGTDKSVMAIGMLGLLIAMGAAAALFARIHPAGAGVASGLKFGGVLAVFVLGGYVLHNHMHLKISARMSALQGMVYAVEWVVVGIVISLVYRG